MSELRRRSDGKKSLVQRSSSTRRIEVEALVRTRNDETAMIIKETRGEMLMIRSTRK